MHDQPDRPRGIWLRLRRNSSRERNCSQPKACNSFHGSSSLKAFNAKDAEAAKEKLQRVAKAAKAAKELDLRTATKVAKKTPRMTYKETFGPIHIIVIPFRRRFPFPAWRCLRVLGLVFDIEILCGLGGLCVEAFIFLRGLCGLGVESFSVQARY
jgi:hypothetical protein